MSVSVDEETYWLLSERVTEGAEVFDQIDADWYWIVDPDGLDMRRGYHSPVTGCGCVVAQHHPKRWFDGVDDYGITMDEAVNFGLTSTQHGDFPTLTELWREAIWDRRAAWFDQADRRAS